MHYFSTIGFFFTCLLLASWWLNDCVGSDFNDVNIMTIVDDRLANNSDVNSGWLLYNGWLYNVDIIDRFDSLIFAATFTCL